MKKILGKTILTVSSAFLLTSSVVFAQSNHNTELTLYFNNNNPQSYYAIEKTECWQIKNDKEMNILNIASNDITKVQLKPTCSKSQMHNNIYKVKLLNKAVIVVRDLPRQNKRCIGILWRDPLTEEKGSRIYCQPQESLSNVQIDLKMEPSNIKFYKMTPKKLGKPILQELQVSEQF
ncbi:MAG: hypothetical protein EP298_05805 [Gammaproteobacteria bacterium]|nr:MAG: hypothetical protein EP298_05805 [Gammaproteobacteria bacterium]UTW41430.1 hypothetical protein KFE69_07865 [bacterium SCSIO 12844]